MTALFKPAVLTDRLWFPDPRRASGSGNLNGLVAIGGDLTVPRLLLAYRSGIFPWSVSPVTWWSPDPRAIFETGQFHVSRSLAKMIRHGHYRVTMNRAFRQVMEACAAPTLDRPSTWITPEFIEAYSALHNSGYAHSVECWLGTRLAGGTYGVAIGGFFAAESMFHRADDASKVALCFLTRHLESRGFALLDIQMISDHTCRLGASTISRAEYLRRLHHAVSLSCSF